MRAVAKGLAERLRTPRTYLLFVPVASVFALAFTVGRLDVKLETAAHRSAVAHERATRDDREEALYLRDLREEDRDLGPAHIATERARAAAHLGSAADVVRFELGGYGGLLVHVRGDRHVVVFPADDPDDFGEYRLRGHLRSARRISVDDLDPAAPLRLVHRAESLSPDGRGMDIDRLTFGESREHDGRLRWTLVAYSDPPATYEADRHGHHVRRR